MFAARPPWDDGIGEFQVNSTLIPGLPRDPGYGCGEGETGGAGVETVYARLHH